MSNLYYVFETEEIANNAEAVICQIAGAPLVGRNAKTGAPAPDKCKTERWAIPQQRLDGKWVFPKVPQALLEQYPQSVIDGFNTTFPNILEEYSEDWFSTVDSP